tara:strand:- start:83 stop:577 length:495 start_codon:yes stop_codon:yes gene_type:complete
MRESRHRRFYSTSGSKKVIPKLQIKTGMIVEFTYRDKSGKPSRPLIFVMDTDEYTTKDKKIFHGVNLNYLPSIEVETLFENIISKTNFEIDKETKFPKVNLFEEEDPDGLKPFVIYKPFVKAKLLNRFDCWRSYKYINVKNVKQIRWNFTSNKLSEVYKNLKAE